MVVDMHTHSENSHDSVCKIEDMYSAQADNGTEIFAVTDHFDTDSFSDYDVFTPIKTAHETILKLKENLKGNQQILRGIEISEGFWHPEICKKVIDMTEYDVIIGSVHIVKYENLSYAYSKIDFSEVSKEVIVDYLDTYFDDMLTMIDTMDFDILAHLTCPLRYIKGKYKIDVDMSAYQNKIEVILEKIIKKGIALEVNSSSYEQLHSFMPSEEIIKKYYDMGGRLVTLGSDAHVAKDASKNFGEAIEVLKKIGFENIYYYKERKPIEIKI